MEGISKLTGRSAGRLDRCRRYQSHRVLTAAFIVVSLDTGGWVYQMKKSQQVYNTMWNGLTALAVAGQGRSVGVTALWSRLLFEC